MGDDSTELRGNRAALSERDEHEFTNTFAVNREARKNLGVAFRESVFKFFSIDLFVYISKISIMNRFCLTNFCRQVHAEGSSDESADRRRWEVYKEGRQLRERAESESTI